LFAALLVAFAAPACAEVTAVAPHATPSPEPILRGLVFVSGAVALAAKAFTPSGDPVDVSRVERLNQPGFMAQMRTLIGQPLTLATLNDIASITATAFEQDGHPAVQVTIPEQDVTSGIVQVVIVEFRIGQVTVEGATHYRPGLYKAAIGMQPGKIIDTARIQAGLRQINANEYRSAEVALRPGTDPETVDVLVRARDQWPVTVSLGYNNAGAQTTGRNQWTFAAGLANTFGNLDDVVAYQLLSSDFIGLAPSLLSHSVTYALAIPGGGQFSMLANYSLARPLVEASQSSHGKSVQLSPRYTGEIFASGDLEFSLRGGYDFKSSNNDLMFGGTAIAQSASDISQFEVAGLMVQADARGRTEASLSAFVSPGRMFAGNDDTSFRGLSPAARAQYVYVRLDATRITELPHDLSWWTHATVQLASNGLLPSEQAVAGGMTTVRGYPADTVRGDAGIMLSNELRFSPASISRLIGLDIGDRIQPFAFLDYAGVKARQTTGYAATDGTLASFGPGVRIDLDRNVSLVLDMGGQMRVESGRHYPGQFFDVAVSLRY
jgi:hemolysin activation/secretion protein